MDISNSYEGRFSQKEEKRKGMNSKQKKERKKDREERERRKKGRVVQKMATESLSIYLS